MGRLQNNWFRNKADRWRHEPWEEHGGHYSSLKTIRPFFLSLLQDAFGLTLFPLFVSTPHSFSAIPFLVFVSQSG